MLSAGAAQASPELIINGGFETAGAPGYATFNSDYSTGVDAHAENTVNIGSNPISLHGSWDSFAPYAGSEMLIVNGGANVNSTVWSQTLALSAGTYNFSALASSVYSGNPATLRAVATIGGIDYTLGTDLLLTSATNAWNTFGGSMTVLTAGNVTLKLQDRNAVASGNDFAVDNISLTSAVPEPETYAMLLAGLGLVGFMSRRKSAKKAA